MVKRSLFRWPVMGVVLAGVAMLVAACGGGSNPAPPAATVEPTPAVVAEQPSPTATVTASPTTAAAASPTPAPSPTAAAEPERAASYSDLLYTITEVVETNETWRSYGGSETQLSNDDFLYVHLDVANRLRHMPLTTQASLFSLESGPTRLEVRRPWSQVASAMVQPGTSVEYIVGFQLPDGFDASNARLVISEPGREPAAIVVQGRPEAQAYPAEALVGDEASPVSAGRGCDDLVVDAVHAYVDLDAGLDASGISGNVEGGRRARAGERFLRFEMEAKAGAGTCALLKEYFRLEVDGSTIAPANFLSTSLNAGQSTTFTLVFRITATAQQIALMAGAEDGNVKPFPIALPSTSP